MNAGRLRALVIGTAAEVLGVAPADLAADGTLTAYATYTSFRVLDIVESLERKVGIEVDADALVPANLRHVDSLCRLLAGPDAGAGAEAGAGPSAAGAGVSPTAGAGAGSGAATRTATAWTTPPETVATAKETADG